MLGRGWHSSKIFGANCRRVWCVPSAKSRREAKQIGRTRNQPRLKQATYLPREADWLDTLLLELLAFPSGQHDDQVDSVSQFLR